MRRSQSRSARFWSLFQRPSQEHTVPWQTLRQGLLKHSFGLGAIALLLALKASGLWQNLALSQLDLLLKLMPTERQDDRIVIVKLDRAYFEGLREQQGDRAYFEYRELTKLLRELLKAEPSIIAVDIPSSRLSGDGQLGLARLFEQYPNLLSVEKGFYPQIPPIPGIPLDQVGLNDFPVDADGKVRRVFIGSYPESEAEDFKTSLSFQIAARFLKPYGVEPKNGEQDEDALEFNSSDFPSIEVPRLQPQLEPYIGDIGDDGLDGVQTLLYFRRSEQPSDRPFADFTIQELLGNAQTLDQLKGRIVILGITTPEMIDRLKTTIPPQRIDPRSLAGNGILGTELQAHAASQLISAVLDNRPLLRGVNQLYSYGLIIGFGIIGCWLGNRSKQSFVNLGYLFGLAGVALVLFCLAFLRWSILIPPVSGLCALIVPGLTYAVFAQRERIQKAIAQQNLAEQEAAQREELLAARLNVISETFGEIHNGPLQRLASLLRQLQDGTISRERVARELRALDNQIRQVGDHLKQEAETGKRHLIRADRSIDLEQPLHELFHEAYQASFDSHWPNLRQLQVRYRSFDPVEAPLLSNEDKACLYRFLEEAICNVGKHAAGVTRLTVTGENCGENYKLTIEDNGAGLDQAPEGEGTAIARQLEQRLGGTFSRTIRSPRGVRCIFSWPL